jgi:glycosyltransferase involved in cell wall biosynthesis
MANIGRAFMRIAMVSVFPASHGVITGGVEGVAEVLVEALGKRSDCNVHVISISSKHAQNATEIRGNLTIHWLPSLSGPGFVNFWTRDRVRIQKCIRMIEPDVVHIQGVAGYALGLERRVVMTVHGVPELDARYDGQKLAILRASIIRRVEDCGRARGDDRIIINPYISEYLGTRLKGRHWQIENPVHPDFFNVARSESPTGFLYVGRVAYRKGIHDLIRIYARYRRMGGNEHLEIAGTASNPRYEAEIRSLITQMSLTNCVSLVGALTRRELLKKMSKTKALLLFSIQETAPLIISESMAAGVPVVAYGVCGVPYMIEDGVTGRVIPVGAQNEAAEALFQFAEDPGYATRLSDAARGHAVQRFSVDSVIDKTLAVYKAVVR